MKVFCLGGAGRIWREAVLDLVQFSHATQITLGDANVQAAQEVANWLRDSRLQVVQIDVFDERDAIAKMAGHDVVMDGTTITLNGQSTKLIAAAGCHGINLNGFGEEYQYHEQFQQQGRIHVPGFGMTPGTTNMMALHAAEPFDRIRSIRVSHGAFRPIAYSAAITETTTYEYDPALPGRVVYEQGEFKQVPPFARPRPIALPEPYGMLPQYIIPHSETKTLAEYFQALGKDVELIEVRGTWPAKNMLMVRALYEYGILANPQIELDSRAYGLLDVIARYLMNSEHGTTTEIYGYALHVEVQGVKQGRKVKHTVWHTHPPSDGSVPEWAGLRAYTRNVGIPLAVGVELIGTGRFQGSGCVIPERAFRPDAVLAELEKRDLLIHEQEEEITDYD